MDASVAATQTSGHLCCEVNLKNAVPSRVKVATGLCGTVSQVVSATLDAMNGSGIISNRAKVVDPMTVELPRVVLGLNAEEM